MKYGVEEVGLDSARGDLERLWSDNLQMSCSARAKYEWYYRGHVSQARSLLLRDQAGTAVGCVGLGARRFFVRGQPYRVADIVDLAVDKAHRTLFPALALQRAARAIYAKPPFAFAYGLPGKEARSVLLRVGGKEVGQPRRYACALRHGPYLERTLPALVPHRPLGKLLDLGSLGLRRVFHAPARHLRLHWTHEIDERFDHLWRRAHPHYTIIGERSAAFLRWRFAAAPLVGHFAVLSDASGGTYRAYAAVVDEGSVARIADIFGEPSMLGSLLDALLPQLYRRGYSAVSLRLLCSAALGQILTRSAFRLRETGPETLVADIGQSRLQDVFISDNWHLTDADADVD